MKKAILILAIVLIAGSAGAGETFFLPNYKLGEFEFHTKGKAQMTIETAEFIRDELKRLNDKWFKVKSQKQADNPKIKAIFWDGTPWRHATEKIRIDLDNGQSIFIGLGEEMPQNGKCKHK